ncbi:MAG TPA: tRNA-dihydrouridine synthase family protein, partial [Bdellovibrionota bacterium]|nr:tRNA-dihydrouridine synthase family protein [Bdellovibrionota bacterium]
MEKLVTNPFIVAPMAGITDMPFRRLMRRLGAGGLVSEFISAHLVTQKDNPRKRRYLAFHEEERPLGIQLFGGDEDILSEAAKVVEGEGVEFVDLNLGCPVPKVTRKGGGSAWLCHPVDLAQMLAKVRSAIKIPLTIKIRIGWDSTSINCAEIVRIAQEEGVAWVAIHGRTRVQGYAGHADWEIIENIARSVKIPVIGNGDVVSGPLAAARLLDSGVAGVMIGRAALKNPWIFQEASEALETLRAMPEAQREAYIREVIDAHQLPEARRGKRYQPQPIEGLEKWMRIRADRDAEALVNLHLGLLREAYPDERANLAFRKFLAWYSAGYPGSSAFRKFIFTTDDFPAILDRANQFFDDVK